MWIVCMKKLCDYFDYPRFFEHLAEVWTSMERASLLPMFYFIIYVLLYHQDFQVDFDYADDETITSNYNTNARVLLRNLEGATNFLGLHINDSKIEFIGFNQKITIQTVTDESIKSIDSFT